MKGPYTMFRTDPKAEVVEGITVDYGSFKIRLIRAGGANAKFKRIMAEKLRPYRKQLEMGTMEEETAQGILCEAYADAVVVGWEGVTDEHGKALPFNRGNVLKILKDLPDLFKDLQEQASLLSNFKAENLEEEAKN